MLSAARLGDVEVVGLDDLAGIDQLELVGSHRVRLGARLLAVEVPGEGFAAAHRDAAVEVRPPCRTELFGFVLEVHPYLEDVTRVELRAPSLDGHLAVLRRDADVVADIQVDQAAVGRARSHLRGSARSSTRGGSTGGGVAAAFAASESQCTEQRTADTDRA